MRKLTKAAGLLFLAAAAAIPAVAGAAPKGAKGGDQFSDPFGAGSAAPTSRPSDADVIPIGTQGGGFGTQQVAVNAGTVEVHVNDANLIEVLRMLSLQSQKNIIASKDVRGSVTADLHDVTIKEALESILHANGFDYREKGNFIYVYTQKELAELEKAQVARRTEIFRLYYSKAKDASDMIKPVLSDGAQVAFSATAKTGIDSDAKDVGGNDAAVEDVLVVTDYPERLDQVRAILREVDRRPQQVLVEAVILRATLQDNNDLGVDFTAFGGVDFNTLSGLNTTTPTQTGIDQALTGTIANNPNAGPILDQGYIGGRAGGSGLKLGVIKNNVGLFITALEAVTDTVVMANPKVLVLNKQKGEVHVGSEQGYRTAVATETLTADDVKFLETGTRLIFRPYVGENGYVRMEVLPEDSSGSVNAQGLPNKFVTKIVTNVMVRDGHTIVIGGLFRESNSRTRSQIPGLGSIPLLGAAFRKQTDDIVREEVIILLTPHIVKDDSAYSADSEKALKDAERLRVGMRKGMMFFGAERLAEASYEQAVKEMEKSIPDNKKALWNLDTALSISPKFTEALELKARIQGKEMSASDNSSIRNFVRRQAMRDRQAGRQYRPTNPATVPTEGSSDLRVKAFAPDNRASAQRPATQPAPANKPAVAGTPAAPKGRTTKGGPVNRPASPTVANEVDWFAPQSK
jgi:type IV pilus assembly protein PilQ